MKTGQKVLLTGFMLLNYSNMWILYTIPLLYLSLKTKSYGINEFHTGVIFAMFSLGALVSIILFMVYRIRQNTNIYYLVAFVFLSEVISCFIMGYAIKFENKLVFAVLSGIPRFIQGFGHSAIAILNTSLSMMLFPNNIQTVVALFQQVSAIGQTIGPIFGVILYTKFAGYYAMYVAIGLIILVSSIFQLFCYIRYDFKKYIQEQDSYSNFQEKQRNRKLFVDKNIIITTIMNMNVFLQLVLPSSYHSVYLKSELKYSESSIANLQMFYGISFLVVPFFLYGNTTSLQRKVSILTSQFFSVIAMFFFAKQEQLGFSSSDRFIKVAFYLQGTCHCLLCSVYQVEAIFLFGNLGFKGNRVNEIVTCIALLAVNVGEMIGPPLGGLLFHNYGFVNGLNIFLIATGPTLSFLYIFFIDWNPKQIEVLESEENKETIIQMN